MYLKLATVLALALAGTSAGAATVFTGDIVEGNTPFPGPLGETPALAKCDEGPSGGSGTCSNWEDAPTEQGGAPGDYADAFTLNYTSQSSFDWTFDPTAVTDTDLVLFPSLIAVKAGESYAIFDVGAGDLFGSASIDGILDSAISHVDFYDTGPGPNVIPLPAGVWLLLGGLGGLAALRRKRAA